MYIRGLQERVLVQDVSGQSHKQAAHEADERMRSVLCPVQQGVRRVLAQASARRVQALQQPALSLPLRRLSENVRELEQTAAALARPLENETLQVSL